MFAKVQLISAIVGSLLYGAAAIPQAAPLGPAPDCARNYTVQAGDFCDGISASQNVSTYQLTHVNSAIIDADCTNLLVGQVLCLGLVGQDCTTTQTVQAGNGCDTIEAVANITFAILSGNNPNINTDCTNIYPGEVLCTAATAIGY